MKAQSRVAGRTDGQQAKMPLDRKLMYALLSHPCPHCGHNLTMKGHWFSVIRNYQCALCRQKVRMTYTAKLALFESHAHLALP
jgi:DNA-directed RNA polymerase subunit RPC12/RpoP